MKRLPSSLIWPVAILATVALGIHAPRVACGQGDGPASAESADRIDTGIRVPVPVDIQGQVSYNHKDGTITVRKAGNEPALVMHGPSSISADEIVYDQNKRHATATGNVRLWNDGMIMTAERLGYDLDSGKGTLFKPGRVDTGQNFFIEGEELQIDRVDTAERWEGRWWRRPTEEKTLQRYTVENGVVTACEIARPYFSLDFSEVEVIPGDRFWLNDVTVNQFGWPIAYLPYFTRSLAEHRVAYFFSAGSFSDLGFGVLNKINVHLDPRFRAAVFADYFADAGLGTGGSFHYHVPGAYGPDGTVRMYWIDQQEHEWDRYETERWRWAGKHMQDLPWGMRLVARYQERSDVEYVEDFDRIENERGITSDELENDHPSYVSLSKSWDLSTLRVTGTKRLDSFFFSSLPGIERLPQARADLMPTQIGDTRLYVDAHLEYGDLRREQGFDDMTNFVDEVERLDAEVKLLYPIAMPWALTVTPFAGYRGTGYMDPSRRDDINGIPGKEFENFSDVTRNTAEAGLTLNSRIAYVWERSDDRNKPAPFGGYDALRFLIQKQLGYGYYHPDEDLEEIVEAGMRFPYVDPTDDIRARMHRVNGRMTTKLQARGGGQSRTLARYGFGLGYDFFPDDNLLFESFDFADDPAEENDRRVSDFTHELNLFPIDWLTIGHFLRYDLDDEFARSSNSYIRFSRWAQWAATVGLNLFDDEHVDFKSQEEAYLNLLLRLSHKWSIIYHSRFDVDDSRARKNRVTFARETAEFIGFLDLIQKDRIDGRDDDFSVKFSLRFKGFGQYLPLD